MLFHQPSVIEDAFPVHGNLFVFSRSRFSDRRRVASERTEFLPLTARGNGERLSARFTLHRHPGGVVRRFSYNGGKSCGLSGSQGPEILTPSRAVFHCFRTVRPDRKNFSADLACR